MRNCGQALKIYFKFWLKQSVESPLKGGLKSAPIDEIIDFISSNNLFFIVFQFC